MSEGSAARDARRAKRRATYAQSTLRTPGARPVDVTVYDISETGIRFACDTPLAVGDELSIGLAGYGATRAFVAWRRDAQYGCDFALPISADAAARAFNAPTVVRFGAAAERDGGPPPALPIADEVDALYARHRRWAMPPDVTAIAALIVAALAVLMWLRA